MENVCRIAPGVHQSKPRYGKMASVSIGVLLYLAGST
jgi:hypothetical protein